MPQPLLTQTPQLRGSSGVEQSVRLLMLQTVAPQQTAPQRCATPHLQQPRLLFRPLQQPRWCTCSRASGAGPQQPWQHRLAHLPARPLQLSSLVTHAAAEQGRQAQPLRRRQPLQAGQQASRRLSVGLQQERREPRAAATGQAQRPACRRLPSIGAGA